MTTVVWGVIVLAVGYSVLKYCAKKGCFGNNKVPQTETKHALQEEILFDLGNVLRRVDGSEYSIDASMVHDIASCEVKEDYLRAYSDMLSKAHELSEFYVQRIENLLAQNRDINSFSKVEKMMLKYAFMFYNETQDLLPSPKAFLLYAQIIEKHTMKASFFRMGQENYTLYFTAPENKQ